MRKIIDVCYQRARDLILANRETCGKIALELLVREVLTAVEVRKIMAGETLPPPVLSAKPPAPQPQGETTKVERKADWKPAVGDQPLPGSAQA